jgi:hypothetical protein
MNPEDIISRKSDDDGNIIVELYETDLIKLMLECDSRGRLIDLGHQVIEIMETQLEEEKKEREDYLSCINDIEKLMGQNIHYKD